MTGNVVRVRRLVSCVALVLFILASFGLSAFAQGRANFELAPEGNEARYRVREQFIGVNLPNDAVGTTTDITGALVLDENGMVVPGESKFVVDIRGLTSDSDSRDRVIQGRVLDTEQFPNVELVIKELRGFTYPLPTTGETTFELVADMTIHGVTKEWTWQAMATPSGDGFAGRATTSFAFGDFGMPVPTSFRLLSVEDNVRLEYDFHLIPVE